MSERTTSVPPPPKFSPGTAERAEIPLGEKIWHNNDIIVHQQYQRAQESLIAEHGHATPEEVVSLAYLAQKEMLEKADTDSWPTSQLTANRLALVVLGTPNAVRAQETLDADENGHLSPRRRRENVMTLSTYNNELGDALTYMHPSMFEDLAERLQARNKNLIEGKWNLPSMDKNGINILLGGKNREVRFLRAFQKFDQEFTDGWEAEQSDTFNDLLGIDITVKNQEGQQLYLDSKTRNAFDRQVLKQQAEGWITAEQAETAMESGYYYRKGKNKEGQSIDICIFDADNFKADNDYEYRNPSEIASFIKDRFDDDHKRSLQKLGKSAIIS
jgi:hypothetical protein